MAEIVKGLGEPLAVLGDGYTNHIDLATDGAGNIFALVIRDKGKGKLNAYLLKRARGTGYTSLVATFDEVAYGKNGYGSIAVVGSHVVVWLASRSPDGTTNPVEWTVLNVAVPWPSH